MSLLKDLFGVQEELLRSLLAHTMPALIWMAAIGFTAAFLYGVYEDISRQLRRNEIARCFLQLLEVGLKQGRSLEQTTVSLSEQRVRSLGVHLHLMAGYIERGLRFEQALEDRARAGKSAFLRVLETFFDGSLEKAVAAHLSDPGAEIGPDELRRLSALIREAKRKET